MEKNKPIQENSIVDELRQIRDIINLEIKDLSIEQLKAYWKKQEASLQKANMNQSSSQK